MDILDCLDRITRAKSVEETWRLLTKAMEAYGFDRLLYGFTRFRTTNSFGDSDDMLILSNHDRSYVEKFVDGRMYQHAPMVRWATEHTGSCSWGWIFSNLDALSDAERKVAEFNRSRGIVAGYTISFAETSVRSRGGIALTAAAGMSQDEVDAVWAASGRAIELLNNVAHLRITNLPNIGRRKLTQRQREALEWVGDGKTTQDIATILGLTTATIEKHLRLAREALNVETTAQAVFKASIQNQIFVVEP
ncbi:LuxR family transcriptional regulator [Roseitranquillus sediminis]|uniref:LuxR family transcriptional regulator n=1 Tax=Roseitranquillus sediminis TaxID=2809051 RepID=UPI001D0CABB4|nr:LuxR family transcriptional regulator [Roseitranquillus sediminis]MBM9595602.1 autoinducer binding domain-containing protein [Roseitranquillus sediminis]